MDSDGKAVEREDYEQLNSSECVHELMAVEIAGYHGITIP